MKTATLFIALALLAAPALAEPPPATQPANVIAQLRAENAKLRAELEAAHSELARVKVELAAAKAPASNPTGANGPREIRQGIAFAEAQRIIAPATFLFVESANGQNCYDAGLLGYTYIVWVDDKGTVTTSMVKDKRGTLIPPAAPARNPNAVPARR